MLRKEGGDEHTGFALDLYSSVLIRYRIFQGIKLAVELEVLMSV